MEERSRLIWSDDAISDLESIWTYYLKITGPETAEKALIEIHNVSRVIAEHPYAGRARDEIRAGLRSIPSSPHIIFYRVTNDIPQITRVLDGRQDIEQIFSSE